MIGSYVWNLIIGGLSGLMAFALAYVNANTFVTSLVRGLISFAVMFLLTYLFRWLLALIIQDTMKEGDSAGGVPTGTNIDLKTPEDDVLLTDLLGTPPPQEINKSAQEPAQEGKRQTFEPFAPPRIKRVEQSGELAASDPALAAKAVRRLTED
jgi:hypothetical protein